MCKRASWWAMAATIALSSGCGDDGGSEASESAAEADTFEEQAAVGQHLYGEKCASCHGASGQGTAAAPRLVGLDEGALPRDPRPDAMVRETRFETAGDVASFVVQNMPPEAPGSLSTEEYLAILAFDLKANGVALEQKLDVEQAQSLTIPR